MSGSCDMPECDSTHDVRAARDPSGDLLDMCDGCRREWPVETIETGEA